MKKLICLLFLTASVALSAEPVFRVDEFGGVFRDEINMNADVADYVKNNPAEASLVAGAFRARVVANRETVAANTKAAQDSAAAQVAAAESAKAQAIADHAAAKAAEIDALKAKVAELEAEVAALKNPPAPAPEPTP